MHSIDAGSQVCNIVWSKHSCELVSTHGYSQNQIIVWQYPSLQQVAKLSGHSYRVLYLVSDFLGENELNLNVFLQGHVTRWRVNCNRGGR